MNLNITVGEAARRLLCRYTRSQQILRALFPPAKYDFNNSVSLNAFASKAARSAVVVARSGDDSEFFIDRAFRA